MDSGCAGAPSERCRLGGAVSILARNRALRMYAWPMSQSSQRIFAGLSNVVYDGDEFDLGHCTSLGSTYAHLFAPNMMAFSKAAAGHHSPGPLRAARGGFAYDVECELSVGLNEPLPAGLNAEGAAWLIVALLRLANYPQLMMPVISDVSFSEAARSSHEPTLTPCEIEPRLFRSVDEKLTYLRAQDLEWVKSVWPQTAEMMKSSPTFAAAFRAADVCNVNGRSAASLLTIWGAIESLFAPSRAELRFRVSAYIAAFQEQRGPKRLELFKHVGKLYDERSKIAHSTADADHGALVSSYIILRNALIAMICNGAVPSQTDLENCLFGVGESECSLPVQKPLIKFFICLRLRLSTGLAIGQSSIQSLGSRTGFFLAFGTASRT